MAFKTCLVMLPILIFSSCAASPHVRYPKEPTAPRLQSVEGMILEVVPLQHVEAQEVAAILTELLDASERAAMFRLQDHGGCALRIPDAPLPLPKPTVRIVADPYSNSLFVVAEPEDMPRLIELIERLDERKH